ncbi:MAG: sulfotransferase [Prochlorotrichaceae cyanobacterium]|jgi:hypothetical protein
MLKSFLKQFLPASYWQERSLRLWYAEQEKNVHSVETAIQILRDRWQCQPSDCSERPIFIFSAGWRAGSTLLQRLINSDPRVLVWGEPYHKGNFVQVLSQSVCSFTQTFPPDSYFINSANFSGSEDQLFSRWTANLYPEIDAFIAAQRVFFQTLYGQPAQQRGFERWGLKEVRLSIDHAIYLKWLFPQGKFLFIYRNPYKTYASCHTWSDLYFRWPDQPVFTPETFGLYWRGMVTGYRRGWEALGGLLLPYEAFCGGEPSTAAIASYLELKLDPAVMTRRIGSQEKKTPLSPRQIQRLQRVVDPLAAQLGYTAPES